MSVYTDFSGFLCFLRRDVEWANFYTDFSEFLFFWKQKFYAGTLSEQVSSRRTWRLGGGFIKYQSTSTLQYDGDTRVRRVSTGVFFSISCFFCNMMATPASAASLLVFFWISCFFSVFYFLLFFCVLLTHTRTHTQQARKRERQILHWQHQCGVKPKAILRSGFRV